jgi:hypothetical protein
MEPKHDSQQDHDRIGHPLKESHPPPFQPRVHQLDPSPQVLQPLEPEPHPQTVPLAPQHCLLHLPAHLAEVQRRGRLVKGVEEVVAELWLTDL